MTLYIKNMVCPRCVDAVRLQLQSIGAQVLGVHLGDAEVQGQLSDQQLAQLAGNLRAAGFELLDDPRARSIEQIRLAVQQWVRMDDERPRLSDFVSLRLCKEYSALSKLFSEVRGITIERFAILHRIEFAKELLSYGSLSISEVAYRVGCSSPAHFSAQFKQVTGLTPKQFQALGAHLRTPLDQL